MLFRLRQPRAVPAVRVLALALASSAGALGAACDAPAGDGIEQGEQDYGALPSLGNAKSGGPLEYGAPVSAPVEVSGDDVVVFPFQGSAGDRVLLSVRPEPLSNALPDVWIVDGSGAVVAGAHDKTFLETKLAGAGSFRVVVREAQRRHAAFTVALNAFVPVVTTSPIAWQIPKTGGETMRAIFALSPSDAWAAGDRGTLLHFDGTALERFDTGVPDALSHVWAAAPSDVWAAGGGSLLHFDGAAWWRMPRPKLATVSLRGSGAKDVWLLEATPTPSGALWTSQHDYAVSRWDGERWATRKDAYASQNWHGATALAVGSASDAWLFAWADSDGASALHWNGLDWNEARSAGNFSPFTRDTSILSATVLPNGNVIAAGGFAQRNLLYLWDGTQWTNLPDEGLYGGTRVSAVWGTSADDLWVVTGDKLFTRRITAWQGLRYDHDDAMPANVTAVHGLSAGAPWTAGGAGQVSRLDGGAWHPLGESALLCGDPDVTGGASEAWIACHRELVRREGGAWARRPVDAIAKDDRITGLWAESADRAWLATAKGAVVKFDAKASPTSRIVAQLASTSLRSIWASSSSDVWLVTTTGTLLRGGDGVAFTPVAQQAGIPPYVEHVVGTAANDVYVVANGAAVSRFDGATWTSLQPSGPRSVQRVRMIDGQLRMVASDGVYALSGGAWQLLASGDLRDAWVNPDGTIDAISGRGALGRFAAGAWTWKHDVPFGRILKAPTGRVVIASPSGVLETGP